MLACLLHVLFCTAQTLPCTRPAQHPDIAQLSTAECYLIGCVNLGRIYRGCAKPAKVKFLNEQWLTAQAAYRMLARLATMHSSGNF